MSHLEAARAAEDVVDVSDNQKLSELDQDTVDINAESGMTTDAGHVVESRAVGPCGHASGLLPSLNAMEKIQHLNHERIPERPVYARGTGAFGTFQLVESAEDVTMANILCDTARKTPVFVRFSNLTGSMGTSDTRRDVRGFAVKMYTEEGNWDILSQNIPVSAVRDAEDFVDFVHCLKPEPHTGVSFGNQGHNNFWDFINFHPESIHMALRLMSDDAIPRSYRMMNGFAVNTFTLINRHGHHHYVRFQWIPVLGTRPLDIHESRKIAGYDSDYYRRDLRESIANECHPKWRLGIQTIPQKEVRAMPFDVFDATHIWPQDKIPLRLVGVLELNHNVDEMYTQVEQAAFRPTNLVPGIALSPDPLLQHRASAYADAQCRRLGVNSSEIPINRACCPVLNHNRDGAIRHRITRGSVNYWPNRFYACSPTRGNGPGSTEGRKEGCPYHCEGHSGAAPQYPDQAAAFIQGLDDLGRRHFIYSLAFSLGCCDDPTVPERFLNHWMVKIDRDIALQLANVLGVNMRHNPDSPATSTPPLIREEPSPVTAHTHCRSLRVGILLEDGYNESDLEATTLTLQAAGCFTYIISSSLRKVFPTGSDVDHPPGILPDYSLLTARSTDFDALFIPGAPHIRTIAKVNAAHSWIEETFWNFKAIAVTGEAGELIKQALTNVPDLHLATETGNTKVDWLGVLSTVEKVRPSSLLDRVSGKDKTDFLELFLSHIRERSIKQRERETGAYRLL